MTPPANGSFWMPPAGSSSAADVDLLFHFILWVAVFFFALIVGLMLVFVVRYRRRAGVRAAEAAAHSLALELTWSGVPLVLVVVIFFLGLRGFVAMATPPKDAYRILVEGQKWSWLFTYPNGHVDSELHVPVDTSVELVLTSLDVIHSFYIPAFRLKKDAVPGRYNKLWFRAIAPGEYPVFCAEYCGTGHSDMLTTCIVHPQEEFEAWLQGADPLKRLTDQEYQQYLADPPGFIAAHPDLRGLDTPELMGHRLYTKKGCAQCHSVDGSAGTGPSLKGIFGTQHAMQDGSTVLVEENYLRQSLLDPAARVRAGYQAVMPTYQGRLKEREINALIAYIRSLADSPPAEPAGAAGERR